MSLTWQDISPDELNKQINPIYYSASRAVDDVLTEWRRVVIQGTAKAREHFKCALDIPYGPGDLQKYDVYGIDLPEDAPIFVFVHGGGWQTGSKDRTGHFSLMHQNNGHRSIALEYRIAPAGTMGDMQRDVVIALKKVVTDYPKASLVLAGHSAGAQLVAQLLHTAPDQLPLPPEVAQKITGLVLISGVYDVRAIVSTYLNDVLKLTMEDAAAASPQLQPFAINSGTDINSLKILVTVGGKESDEFHRQSAHYYEKLKSVFPNTTIWTSPEDDHFTIIEYLAVLDSAIAQKILQFLQ